MITVTRTRTWELLHAWAETTPVPENEPGHYKGARVGDLCTWPPCGEHFRPGETVYSVTEQDRSDALPGRTEPWVCWRHVRPDEGPLKV